MKISRLFEIVYILLEKESVTARELAEHFEISTRTVYRDIEMLSGAGIPVYMSKGKGGGISLLPEFVLNKAMITQEERQEILSSLSAMQAIAIDGVNGSVTKDAAGITLRKLGSLFGKSDVGNADTNWIEVNFSSWSDGQREAELFRVVKEAVIRKQVLQFSYAGVKGKESFRVVEPLKLVYKGEAWYLYAFCRVREDYRFFKLKRIHDVSKTEEIFERVCPQAVLEKGGQADYRQSVKLKLRIGKEMAYRVYDEFTQYRQLEDGCFLVEMEFPDSEWAVYYILGFGRYCEVLGPGEMRQRVKEEAEKIRARYECR